LTSIDQEDWAEVLTSLIDGREAITLDELLALAPELEQDTELLETLLEDIASLGVAVAAAEDEEPAEEKAGYETPDLETIHPEDLLTLYLAELSQEPLLTHEDEIELARQIEMGRLAQKTLEETDYTAAEYRRLEALVEEGQAAREHLGRANTRLVVSIAKRYRGYGIPFTDLIQDGNVGLMRAVDHYDHRTGNRFSTYATWWIRQAVTRSLSNHGRLIRIPVHTGGLIRRMTQVSQRMEMEHGEQPTPDDIAAEMGESPDKVRQMMRWATETMSLEQPMGEEGDVELQDFVEDEEVPQPEEATDTHLLSELLAMLLNNLSFREVQILRLRYGLKGAQVHTLGQIGEKLGLSRERVRQIEREALAKLRLVSGKHRLEQFL
jgi:RNA polymerase primary sigma factor